MAWRRQWLRRAAAGVLVFFAWQSFDPYQILNAQGASNAPAAARRRGASRGFEQSVRAIRQLAQELEGAFREGKDVRPDLATLGELRRAAREGDRAIRDSFEETAATLKSRGASSEVVARHQQAVAAYDLNAKRLLDDLDALDRSTRDLGTAERRRDTAGVKARSDEIKQETARIRSGADAALDDPAHTPLDPNNLPHRTPKPKERTPRLQRDQFDEPRKLLDVAANGNPFALVPMQEPPATPTSDDLAQTIDVQLTPGITDLATSLGGNPVAIFNWVRQHVAFVPTFGSIQGSEACRLSLECNAHDTASLLIALLRASGIPARYVMGTVELTPNRFRSAMGDFENVAAAARFASSGGIPVVQVTNAGTTVAVRMEHVWVEAYVDYIPSRGAVKGPGDTWVALDAALKPMRFQRPLDLKSAGVDAQATFDSLLATGVTGGGGSSITGISQLAATERVNAGIQQLKTFIDSSRPDATVGDVLGALEIRANPVSVLPASLPERVLVIGARAAELPAATRHQVTLQVMDRFGLAEEIRVEQPTSALAGKRVTLGYVPAGPADVATIETFGGLLEAPPYLVHVRPVVYVEGVPVAHASSAVAMGTSQLVRVGFKEPDGSSDSVEHVLAAGTYAALGLDLQRVTRESVETRKAKLAATQTTIGAQDLSWDDLLGETLHVHALAYFLQTEASNRIAANQLNVVALKRPAEMLATSSPVFSFLFGAPVDVTRTGMNVDVRRYIVSASSRTGDRDHEREYVLTTGTFASAAEHSVFEHLQNARSVSAVKLLAEANTRGIPIFAVDASNAAAILPQLRVSASVTNDIRNSVASGKRVLVPREEVPFLDWRGVGYIVADPETGAAGYLISGGLAGGGTAEQSSLGDILDQIRQILQFLLDEFTTIAGALRVLSKAAAWAERIGQVLVAISALATGYSMYSETGSIWKGLAAGLIDLGLSLAAGAAVAALVPLVGTSVLGIIGLAVAILVVTVVVTLIENAILNVLKNVGLIILERYALRRALRLESVLARLTDRLDCDFAWGAAA